MLRLWFRVVRSAFVVLGSVAGGTGFFLQLLRSSHEERWASGETDLGCKLKPLGDPLCKAAMIDHLPGATEACEGKSASDGCDLVLSPISIPGECAPGPGHSLFCAPRHPGATTIPPTEKVAREQSTIRF